MKLSDYLSRKRVAVLEASDKREALNATLALFEGMTHISSQEKFAAAIWEREEVLPTGIGLGIGVPHVRCESVRDPAAALVVLRRGVDYGSLDGAPVRVILMIAMPDGAKNDYLQYLANASRLFQRAPFRNALLACDNPDQLWEIVSEA
jgi:mannitol/fructose-specific phosphotransferase system IIA component (Ntr-type)